MARLGCSKVGLGGAFRKGVTSEAVSDSASSMERASRARCRDPPDGAPRTVGFAFGLR